MPHPILKKTRGPSSTGPRPTARFISPHESEETEPDSPVGTNSHVVVQPPSPDPENMKGDNKSSGPTGGKKMAGFVASTAARKKRPVIVRRQSSQTSQSSTDSPHPAGSMQSPAQRTPPTASEHSLARIKQSIPSKFQEKFSPSNRSPSSTAYQKSRTASKGSDSKRNSPRKDSVRREQTPRSRDLAQEAAVAGPSNRLRPVENDQDDVEDLTADELEQFEIQRTLLEQASTFIGKSQHTTSQMQPQSASNDRVRVQRSSQRSTSNKEHGGKDQGGMRVLPHDAKSTTSLAPTLTPATGQLDLKASAVDKSRASSIPSSSASKGKGKDPVNLPRAEMFTKRPIQSVVVPDPELSGSLSRSKSQLTLLLEKDRARGSDNTSSKWRKQ